MRKQVVVAVLALFVLLQGCSVTVRYAPPMRRHVKPMLDGAVAVLQTKVNTEDGEVYMAHVVFGKRSWRLSRYKQVMAESLATAIEFTGIAPSARVAGAPAENLMAWIKSSEAKRFKYVIVPELTRWDSVFGAEVITFFNPFSLLGLFGVPTIRAFEETSCELNIQVIDVDSGETVMMFTPKRDYSQRNVRMSVFSRNTVVEEHLLEFQRRLMDTVRETMESRALLYDRNQTVLPY